MGTKEIRNGNEENNCGSDGKAHHAPASPVMARSVGMGLSMATESSAVVMVTPASQPSYVRGLLGFDGWRQLH